MRCARERQHTNDDGHIAQQHFSGGSARYGCARLTHGAKGGWSKGGLSETNLGLLLLAELEDLAAADAAKGNHT